MNQFKKIMLEHNIPLYLCVDPSMKNMFVSYNVRYGSSGLWFHFQNNGKDYHVGSGYAHYLEHLLGEHSQFGDMYRNFEQRLQSANAYTADDVTSYHFKGKDEVEKSIEELILSMEQPVFNQEDVDATRHAIEEEAASYCDDPGVMVVDFVENNLYDGFSKFDETLSPIGNRETTKAMTIDHLYDCYNAFYTDDKKFIVVAGNVDENKIVDTINNALSKVQRHPSHLVLPEIDFHGIKAKDGIIYRSTDEPISALGIKVKKPDFIDMKKFDYIMTILQKNSYQSKASNDLNRRGILSSTSYCYLTNVDDYINFIISFTTPDKDMCTQQLLELFSKKDISKKDYELLQKVMVASEVRAMENKYEYIQNFPDNIYCTDTYSDIDFYQSVSFDEFREILEALDFSQYTVGEVKQFVKK